MLMLRQAIPKNYLKINRYSFEQVQEFKYLNVNINENNNIHAKVKLRLSASNKCY